MTYALGSCIGLMVYDPVVRIGGLLHFMLPESSISPLKAVRNPFLFADTGIPLLFRAAYRLGAEKDRMTVCAVG
ncbi:MAG: chemotaxis protein CheD, partial [Bryobacterales bacterium]|nr:chemotaxis protein CheD [Bryobacterales bacterium]